ncbi:MAG: GAF domain-containing protein [Armatimonadetes bacterium]|nr:GAF domain-containing protein [Armatimonadota bacterium]
MRIHTKLLITFMLVAVVCAGFSAAVGLYVALAHLGQGELPSLALWQVAGLSLFTVLVCVGGASWLVWSVCEPLWELRRRVQNANQDNTSLEIYSRAHNEIGELAEEMDALRRSLLSQIRRQEKRVVKMHSLGRVSASLNVTRGLTSVSTAALDIVMRELEMKLGALYLVDESGQHLEIHAQEGLPARLPPAARRLPSSLGWLGRTAQSGQLSVTDEEGAQSWLSQVAPNRDDLRQIASVPLRSAEGVEGVMVLGSHHPQPFSPEDLEILTTVGSQIGMAIENARTFEQARHSLSHIQGLLAISQEVARSLSVEAVLDVILAKAKDLIQVDTCAIFFLEERTKELTIVRSAGLTEDFVRNVRFKVGEGSVGRAVSDRRAIAITDVAVDPNYSELEMLSRQEGYYSVLSVPLLGPERVFGGIEVYSSERRQFTEDEVRLLSIFANQASIAIANAELHESATSRLTALNALFKTVEFLSASSDPREIMDMVVTQVFNLFPCNLAYIMMEKPETHELEVIVSRGFTPEFQKVHVDKQIIPVRKCWAMKKGNRFEVEDDESDFTCQQIMAEGPARSYLCAPLTAGGKTFGVMHMSSNEPRRFTKEDADLFTTLANQVAIASERAQLFQKVEQLAITDSLTGLYNYRYFRERLNEAMRHGERYSRSVSLLMMDLDHFKQHNDTFGHPSGDRLLRKVSEIVADCLREVDFLARYGGEEFAVILQDTEKDGALAVAEKIRASVEKATFYGDAENPVLRKTISVGVAALPMDAETDEALINEADTALYRAKESGRNRVCAAGDPGELRQVGVETGSQGLTESGPVASAKAI